MSTRANYFSVVTVDGYAFPVTPQVDFGFNSQGFSFLNRGLFPLEYSFDGINLHGDLSPNDASKGLTFDWRKECKVFFRAVYGYGTVRVEAWSD
jgi:hypothetical protein